MNERYKLVKSISQGREVFGIFDLKNNCRVYASYNRQDVIDKLTAIKKVLK